MTDWFEPFTRLTPPTDDVMWSKCRVGHWRQHGTIIVAIESPQWPMSTMEVYNWEDYGGPELDWWQEYCPAQDVVSRSIDQTGVWEPYESALFVDILKRGLPDPKPVLDFGCQIGWYSAIAERYGYPVFGYDVNPENVALAKRNAPNADMSRAVIDERSNVWAPQPIRVAKIDIEGAEQWAIRIIQQSLDDRLIDYVLMEVSPVFNDSYPDLVEQVAGYGYEVYVIPHSAPRVDNPLETLMRHPLVEQDRRSVVAAFHQEDLLFARRP